MFYQVAVQLCLGVALSFIVWLIGGKESARIRRGSTLLSVTVSVLIDAAVVVVVS